MSLDEKTILIVTYKSSNYHQSLRNIEGIWKANHELLLFIETQIVTTRMSKDEWPQVTTSTIWYHMELKFIITQEVTECSSRRCYSPSITSFVLTNHHEWPSQRASNQKANSSDHWHVVLTNSPKSSREIKFEGRKSGVLNLNRLQ